MLVPLQQQIEDAEKIRKKMKVKEGESRCQFTSNSRQKMLRGSEPAGRMNIGSEKFGALQEILPINFYEAKIWISDTFLRK